MRDFLADAHLWWPGAVVMAVLTIISAFYSAAETALFCLSHDELRAMRAGKSRERLAAALLAEPERLLTAILFCNLVTNLVYFAVSFVVAARLSRYGQGTAAVTFGFVSLVVVLVMGEVLPKGLAVVLRKRLAAWVSWPVALSIRALDPVIPLLRTVTRVAQRTFWPDIQSETQLQPEDLEKAVDTSHRGKEVVRRERQVLHNILDLSEIAVEEVMRPRGAYVVQSPPVHLRDLKGEVPPGDCLGLRGGNAADDLESVVPLAEFSSVPDQHLERAAEEIVFVPWCATLAYTLHRMRDEFASAAAVVNEYGDTIGVVLYEDIIDSLLDAQPDRGKRVLERDPVHEVAPGTLQAEGITTLRHLAQRLDVEFDADEEDAVTIAGLLHDRLEHIPNRGDVCTWRGHRIRVIEVSKRGQVRVLITTDQPPPETQETSVPTAQ